MSRSRLLRTCAAPVAAAVAAALPRTAAGHAIGGTYQLPVPLWLYLAGAGAAVAASFVVVALMRRRPPAGRAARLARLPSGLVDGSRWPLRVLGLVWWYGAIAIGLTVGEISRLPSVLLWVGIWIALPILAALAGNSWPTMSPFRTTFQGIEWLARRAGLASLDAGVRYPRGLARWPAVVLLGLAIWSELILPGGELAPIVGGTMLAYTFLALFCCLVVGRETWLRNGELFEVGLAWYGRIGPIGPLGRLRGWFTGLTEVRGLGWSDAAFVVMLVAGVTYDGMRETAFGATLLDLLLPPVQAAFGLTLTAFVLVDTLAFALVYATFLAAFVAVIGLSRRITGRPTAATAEPMAAAYAAALMPIAAGYVIAHYLTLVIQAIVWIPSLLVTPQMTIAPEIGWIPIAAVWYLSVAAIVGGHVAGVTLAHRHALEQTPARAARSGLPMVVLMVGYTVLSLWIIAQPIVVEPGPQLQEASALTSRSRLH